MSRGKSKLPPPKTRTHTRVFELLAEKEKKLGRRIKAMEIARETGISDKTVTALINGNTTRFDAHTVDALMTYFELKSYDQFFEKRTVSDGTQADG